MDFRKFLASFHTINVYLFLAVSFLILLTFYMFVIDPV
ncbi:hypothetical protein L289_0420 [Acinetobacter gerneri DSM 14967 = CIP 107464 = MTCC 9824]|uniref:Uncharacterized protein n=1 Tax=Acinetobacter gerneri DSM 14967 = CIP 107464 = MTCC 9824 TaxID=1120926 RepID=N8Y9E6_9GAMM|nr:hypothetical protein F960_02632 [Acinetobacter gerneri DSM 14967 = CIP 107464 = MTCC 9824]EPR80658.1 hypothetical protein L289_0420 [Acinetobacter gerneri DSM 14967 = CIP 107464 = MTCC 9824]